MRKNQKILKLQNDFPRSNSAAASIRQKRLRCGLTPESFFNKFVQNAWHRCHRRRCDLPWSVALLLFFFQVCLYVRVCHNRKESARRAASTTRNTTECKQAARASVDHCHSYKEKKKKRQNTKSNTYRYLPRSSCCRTCIETREGSEDNTNWFQD